MKSFNILVIALLLLTLGLAACKKDSTPTPAKKDSPLVSPLNSPISVPDVATPTSSSQISGPGFLLDQPVLSGATKITGQGPFDLSIVIIDMTTMGTPLGYGSIDSDGKLSVSLDLPAIENHVIGVQVMDDREFSPEDIEQLKQRKGPGFKTYPRVGNVLDSVIVRAP
jgi:hypothetical protein